MRETVIEVEYPLVESQLKELDEQLEKAILQLNWTSEGTQCFATFVARSFSSSCVPLNMYIYV